MATSPKKEKAKPAYLQEPFQKQLSRAKAIQGKLLEDAIVARVFANKDDTQELEQDSAWTPDQRCLSHYQNFGVVHQFANQLTRNEARKAGHTGAAMGSNWRPMKPPNESLTRPSSASPGVAFTKQITRKQDVNGKLLEDKAMTRFLFAQIQAGPEYYEGAHGTIVRMEPSSHRKRPGMGSHSFRSQVGRLPLHRCGARAAAEGTNPSHWEPGVGYSETMHNKGRAAGFDRQVGRVALHLSGLRGAPPKMLDESAAARPMSAPMKLGGGTVKPPMHLARKGPKGNLPVKHIQTPSIDKQLSRDAWTNKPLRT